MSVELKVYLFIWSHNFRFSMSLSLSPNSLYCQTTDCTEGGGLTREHCIYVVTGTESSMKLNKSNGKNTDSVSMKMQNSTMYNGIECSIIWAVNHRLFFLTYIIIQWFRNYKCLNIWPISTTSVVSYGWCYQKDYIKYPIISVISCILYVHYR
jgi:hypothetical protein